MRQWTCIAAVTSALFLAGSACALEKKDLKRALDRGGNWLIDQFDPKEKVFGKGDEAKDVVTVAMCVKALCDNPRFYNESNGPYISEPVKYILSQIGEDGKLKGDRQAEDHAWVIAALKANGNEKHRTVMEKCEAAGCALSGSDNVAKLRWDIALLRTNLGGAPIETKESFARKGGRAEDNDALSPGQLQARAEAEASELLKAQQKDGSFSGNIRTHAAYLMNLNRCYKGMK
jgi:hypothetical protein